MICSAAAVTSNVPGSAARNRIVEIPSTAVELLMPSMNDPGPFRENNTRVPSPVGLPKASLNSARSSALSPSSSRMACGVLVSCIVARAAASMAISRVSGFKPGALARIWAVPAVVPARSCVSARPFWTCAEMGPSMSSDPLSVVKLTSVRLSVEIVRFCASTMVATNSWFALHSELGFVQGLGLDCLNSARCRRLRRRPR